MATLYPYTAKKQDDGKFLIQFIDFPTGVTEAATVADIPVLAREVLEGLVEAYKEEGITIPKASPVSGGRAVALD